jgi:hypothetical protein
MLGAKEEAMRTWLLCLAAAALAAAWYWRLLPLPA